MLNDEWKLLDAQWASLQTMWGYTKGYRPWVDSVHDTLPLVERILTESRGRIGDGRDLAEAMSDRYSEQLKAINAAIDELTTQLAWLPGGAPEYIAEAINSLHERVKELDVLSSGH